MRFESQIELNTAQARGKHKQKQWRVCPTCLDAFQGTPGTECSVCGGITQLAPLFDMEDDPEFFICDTCGWKATGEITKIGRFVVCERCVKINDGVYPDRFVKKADVKRIKKEIERATVITELMERR